jgi:RNA polymerase sigma factor (sigma-70 family)
MHIQSTDSELIDEVLAGNQSAYALLVKRHQRFVFSLAMRFAKKREDAEEIAQDCFVKAYRSLYTFKRTSKFSTWLYSIVYTTSITFLRRNKPEAFSLDDENVSLQIENQTGGLDIDLAEVKSRSKFIEQAINMLLPDDAAIISLFYLGEQSLEEIGRTLGMETNTVKVKLFRARHRLKEKLEHTLKHEVKELL